MQAGFAGIIATDSSASTSYRSLKATDGSTMRDIIGRVTAVAEQQAMKSMQQLHPAHYPLATLPDGGWQVKEAGDWTSGFFPGIMWQLHGLTGKQMWADKARQWQAGLANQQLDWIAQHDLGFIYMPSFAHSYLITNDTEDKRQALAAAEALAWAYNPATSSLRTFEGWQPPGATHYLKQIVIIDFMINIPLLMWASRHVGKPQDLRMFADPETTYREMAINHARQVAKNHIRPDGTSYHIVEYQPLTGGINKRYTYQGYKDNSTWARGQSWAILGFAWMYQETHMPEFLDTAKKVADAWLGLLMQQEGPAKGEYVPKWDFHAPYIAAVDGPRDSAAAAVAALGMLHLAEADGLIELAEGETLPVVDENGNQLGTLHADGRVLDEAGTEIGALDEEGNVVLYEQQQPEAVGGCREAAEKFQRRALEAVTASPGAARPEIIAEVASSLADMLYASEKLLDAKEALQVALDAAEQGEQFALYIKLSNNMGAVLRKQELHEEGKQLHEKAMAVALQHFGVAHATTTLARGNLVDALDQLVMLAVDSVKARTACIRAQIELARLEMKDKHFERAVEVLEGALDMAKQKFGDQTAEASSVMAALATCHRQAGDVDKTITLFTQLFDINKRQSGDSAANQSGIMLARTLTDVCQEAGKLDEALGWAEKSLNLMQQLAGVKVHPALEPYFNLVIDLKNQTGGRPPTGQAKGMGGGKAGGAGKKGGKRK
eukprot:gene5761-6001_t